MKLYDFGLVLFVLFVVNCLQFEKARKICEENHYESKGCKVHKDLKYKKLQISYK